MEALQLEDFPGALNRITMVAANGKKGKVELKNKSGKVSRAHLDLCIGCGVCAYKCPTKSLALEHREVIQHPPQTGRDWVMQFFADRQAALTRLEQEK